MSTAEPSTKGPIRIGRLIGGIALAVVAVVLLLGGLGANFAATWLASRDPVAEIQGPGKLTLDAGDGKYTVALGTADGTFKNLGLSRAERREKYRVYDGDVAATRCTIDHPDGDDETIRGDRQGSATTIGERYATVGTFTGRGGKTIVDCRFDPPTITRFAGEDGVGARKVERRVPIMVHERGGFLSTLGWAMIMLAIVLGVLGTLQILRATALRRPRAAAI